MSQQGFDTYGAPSYICLCLGHYKIANQNSLETNLPAKNSQKQYSLHSQSAKAAQKEPLPSLGSLDSSFSPTSNLQSPISNLTSTSSLFEATTSRLSTTSIVPSPSSSAIVSSSGAPLITSTFKEISQVTFCTKLSYQIRLF